MYVSCLHETPECRMRQHVSTMRQGGLLRNSMLFGDVSVCFGIFTELQTSRVSVPCSLPPISTAAATGCSPHHHEHNWPVEISLPPAVYTASMASLASQQTAQHMPAARAPAVPSQAGLQPTGATPEAPRRALRHPPLTSLLLPVQPRPVSASAPCPSMPHCRAGPPAPGGSGEVGDSSSSSSSSR
jgi:hypothetical protein